MGTSKRQVLGRDWRDMTRHDFDPGAPAPVLFDATPDLVAPDDAHGTGDLLALLVGES